MTPTFREPQELKLITEFLDGAYKHMTTEQPQRRETWTRREVLREDSLGRVYKEHCAENEKVRAVKEVKKSLFRHHHLLRVLARLRLYPEHFEQQIGWFEDGYTIYLAMEYLPHDLGQLLQDWNISEDDTKRVTKQILAGLEVTHNEGICHRDLEPRNILVAKLVPISVRIAGFDVCKDSKSAIELRTMMGKPRFVAPEIWGLLGSESSVYTTAVDIWSLGCLMFHMFTNTTPFLEFRDLTNFILGRGSFPPRSESAHSIPQLAVEFMSRLLQPLPEDRVSASRAQLDPWLLIKEQSETPWSTSSSISQVSPMHHFPLLPSPAYTDGTAIGVRGGEELPLRPAAAADGNSNPMKLLSDMRTNVLEMNAHGRNALHIAAHGGMNDAIKTTTPALSVPRIPVKENCDGMESARYRLETTFNPDGLSVVHTTHLPCQPPTTDLWTTVHPIGRGANGIVTLQSGPFGRLRAVKHVLEPASYTKEVAALARVSDVNPLWPPHFRGHHYRHHHHHNSGQPTKHANLPKRHDLFVEFYGWYEDRNFLYIAMEYVENGDLGAYLKKCWERPLPEGTCREVTRQLLRGLEVLHERQICHRDLKPQNILVASLDPIRIKITDFGASKYLKDNQFLTRVGTNGYVAPEVLGLWQLRKGRVILGYAVDLWAAGCIIWEVLTSRGPFQLPVGDTGEVISGLDCEEEVPETNMVELMKYCQGQAKLPVEILKDVGVSTEATEVVSGLLSADPSTRSSASESLQLAWLLEPAPY